MYLYFMKEFLISKFKIVFVKFVILFYMKFLLIVYFLWIEKYVIKYGVYGLIFIYMIFWGFVWDYIINLKKNDMEVFV